MTDITANDWLLMTKDDGIPEPRRLGTVNLRQSTGQKGDMEAGKRVPQRAMS